MPPALARPSATTRLPKLAGVLLAVGLLATNLLALGARRRVAGAVREGRNR
jgi:hypothetical protein